MTSLDELKRLFKENILIEFTDKSLICTGQIPTKPILDLIESHEQLQIDAKKDYEDMRKFQLKFIESDHKRIDLEDKLDKACAALELAEKYLTDRGIRHKGEIGRTIVLPKIDQALAEIRKKDDNG